MMRKLCGNCPDIFQGKRTFKKIDPRGEQPNKEVWCEKKRGESENYEGGNAENAGECRENVIVRKSGGLCDNICGPKKISEPESNTQSILNK